MKVCIIFSICIAAAMCGHPLTRDERLILERESRKSLIGGRPAKQSLDKKYFEFPWMVSLHFKGEFKCSSFLVTTKFMMTAAHCVASGQAVEDPKDFNAYMGTVKRDGPDNEVTFTEIIVHEKYVRYENYDIALMKLAKPVVLRYNIQTICLPTKDSVYMNTTAQAMGWGYTQNGKRETSKTLQTLTEKVVANSMCNFAYNKLYGSFNGRVRTNKTYVTGRHICAGGDRDKGNCFGDSGGPLVAMLETMPVAIGVCSFGTLKGCALENVPTVFTATTMYTDWIVEHMGADANDLCFLNKTFTPTQR